MTQAVPEGWYTDPQDPARRRYWDGSAWTAQTEPSDVAPPTGAADASVLPSQSSAVGGGRSVTLSLPGRRTMLVGGGVLVLLTGVIVTLVMTLGASSKVTLRGHMEIVGSENISTYGGECSGSDGYDDLSGGASITVTDPTGKVVATGSIGTGQPAGDGYLCDFPFEIPDVPSARFYGIEISHRGVVTFSKAQATKDAELSIGS